MDQESSFTAPPDLDRERLPRHIAIIMDGNGRWAKRRNLSRIEGHAHGIDAVREIVRACRRLDIPYLTLYAFSMENWNRPRAEVEALLDLLRHFIRKELPELEANGVRVNTIGRIELLPADIREEIDQAQARTKDLTAMTLTIAISYSGRDELRRAAQKLAAEVRAGRLDPERIDEAAFAGALETAGLPDPDLLIRTSGELRVSNFLLWQIAYAEIHVTEVLWPDFTPRHLFDALLDYTRRERRFGKTSEQLTGPN